MNEYGRGLTHSSWPDGHTHQQRLERSIAAIQDEIDAIEARWDAKLAELPGNFANTDMDLDEWMAFRAAHPELKSAMNAAKKARYNRNRQTRTLKEVRNRLLADLSHHRKCLASAGASGVAAVALLADA